MNTRTSLTIGLPAFLLFLGGCIIVDGNTNDGTGGLGGRGGNTTVTASTTSTGSAGAGGMGGAGGAGGAGVGGNGGGCVGPEDGILDKLACEALNTQATGNVCGPSNDLEPLSIGTCEHGFDIFQRGAFDVLAKCLKGIPGDEPNACNDALVTECVADMYKAACPSQASASTCQDIATTQCIMGETFDTQGCLLDTNPLNTTALQQLVDCIALASEPNCNKAYTDCMIEVRAVPDPKP